MQLGSVVLLALALALDAFAVSVAAGLAVPRVTGRHVFRAAFHFGLFQAVMPVVGWAAGRTFAGRIAAVDHWVAFGLLGFLGAKMLLEARSDGALPAGRDPTRGWKLVTLSVATSIDALAAGLGLAVLGVSVWVPAAVIGLVTGGLCVPGILFGARLGRGWGRAAEAVGGLVLVGIGLRILVEHLLA